MNDDLDRDLQARFERELAEVKAPATWSLAKRPRSPLNLALSAAMIAVLLVGTTAGGLALRAARESRSAERSSPPAASPGAASSPTTTAAPVHGANTFENAVLGYRITLPEGYRRSIARIETRQGGSGVDLYTQQTEAQAREQCQRDSGDVGSQFSDRDPDVRIGVTANPGGLSAVEWVTTPRTPGAQPLSTHQRVEQTTIGGHEAVRLVADNATALTTAFLIRANDRMYELDAIQSVRPQPKTWLDDIAATFVALSPTPFPTPTATVAPRTAARGLADGLARAFAARDADAVARLMPGCWVFVSPLIDGQSPGGVLYRSVALFTEGLRDRFAAGDLRVTVDPTLQTTVDAGGEHFFVRSDWREADRTTRVDLSLTELDGRWTWSTAVPHYTSAQLLPGNCIPYRSPWVSVGAHCSASTAAPAGANGDRFSSGGRTYRLTADLWRDFMPISPPGGRPLIASLKLTSEDGSVFPLSIDADHLWVANGDQTWETSSLELRRSPDAGTPSNALEIVARDGPLWEPGARVDVTLRVRAGGTEQLLRLRGVEIQRSS